MATHIERSRRMYGGEAPPAEQPAEKPKVISRAQAGKTLYPAKPAGSGASYEACTGAYYSRRIAMLNGRNDREQVEFARAEEKQVAAFARKWKISPEDVGLVLDRLRDHETFPRSKEALESRRTQTLESLRIELGSAEAAKKAIDAAVKVTTDLAQTIPGLATRANATGAGEDGVLLKTLAKYGDNTPEPPPAAA
jgi:hypothetical protein